MRDYSGRPETTRMSHYLRTGRLLPANYCAHHKSHHPDYGGADFFRSARCETPGNQEYPGGTPYKIVAHWRERFGWKGSF